jgi:hypothetical protein
VRQRVYSRTLSRRIPSAAVRPGLPACALILAISSAHASTLEVADFQYHHRSYTYRYTSVLTSPFDRVREIVTDHNGMTRLNDSLLVSEVMAELADGRVERKLVLHTCVWWWWCFDLTMVEMLTTLPNGDIQADIVPDQSSFRQGSTIWRVEPVGDRQTRVTILGNQTPGFWVPPFIGPAILKRQFLREAAETVDNIERLASVPRVQ